MKLIVGLVRYIRVFFALVVVVLGGLGQSLPVHAGMARDAASMSAMHAMTPVPMDHSGQDGMSDADNAACELRCLALAVALPVSPAVAVPIGPAKTMRAHAVLLPLPHESGPDGPPPKRPAL